jgi:hypothetical protein
MSYLIIKFSFVTLVNQCLSRSLNAIHIYKIIHINSTITPLYQILYYASSVSKYSSTHYLHDLFKISHLLWESMTIKHMHMYIYPKPYNITYNITLMIIENMLVSRTKIVLEKSFGKGFLGFCFDLLLWD